MKRFPEKIWWCCTGYKTSEPDYITSLYEFGNRKIAEFIFAETEPNLNRTQRHEMFNIFRKQKYWLLA